MNMSLVFLVVNYGDIDADDSACHGYYITIFYSSPYTLQAYFNIDGKDISSVEMVCEGTYYFPINTNSHYYVSPTNKPNNTINMIFYDSNDVVPLSLRKTPQNDFNSLTPLHIPT